jgi:hypothetical protein
MIDRRRPMSPEPDPAQERGPEQLFLMPPRREILTSEGHVADWPIFVLNSKLRKPTPDVEGLDKHAALAKITDAFRRTVVIEQTDSSTGRRVARTCIVTASPDFGFPGDLAQRIFYLLVSLWVEQKRQDDPRVYVTWSELCKRLGIAVNGKNMENIRNQLLAMKAQVIEFRNAWVSKKPDERRGKVNAGSRTVSLIADWDLACDNSGHSIHFNDIPGHLAAYDAQAETGAPKGLPWILLGSDIFESLRGRYIMPADTEYANLLKPTARRLYFLLNKRMGNYKWSYPERFASLAARLPLDGDRASTKERTLIVALEQLCTEVTVGRSGRKMRFLSYYEIRGGGKERVMGGSAKREQSEDKTSTERTLTVYFEGRTPLAEFRRRQMARVSQASETGLEDECDLESGAAGA